MKKILSSLFLLGVFCMPAFSAEQYSTVCANHILVPTEMDAIKLKSQIKSFEDFQTYAKMYSQCPSGKNGGVLKEDKWLNLLKTQHLVVLSEKFLLRFHHLGDTI